MKTTVRVEHAYASPPAKWPDREPVTVQVAEPHAVFWNDEQRSGTLHKVPLELAVKWLREGWAAYFFAEPETDKLLRSDTKPTGRQK